MILIFLCLTRRDKHIACQEDDSRWKISNFIKFQFTFGSFLLLLFSLCFLKFIWERSLDPNYGVFMHVLCGEKFPCMLCSKFSVLLAAKFPGFSEWLPKSMNTKKIYMLPVRERTPTGVGVGGWMLLTWGGFLLLVSRMTYHTVWCGPSSFFKVFDVPSLMPNVLENVKDTLLKLGMWQTVKCHLKQWCMARQNQVQCFQYFHWQMYSDSQEDDISTVFIFLSYFFVGLNFLLVLVFWWVIITDEVHVFSP